jgi:hypothetical protein
MIEQEINAMIKMLPIYLKREVLHYVQFLARKNSPETPVNIPQKTFKFDWEGGLADINENLTSVELQHKAMEWR